MSIQHGKAGRVMLSVSAAAAAVAIAMSGWTLNREADRVAVPEFGDTNKKYVQGLPDVQGGLKGWWNDADDSLFDAAESTDGVKLYLYPFTGALTQYWYGPAWLNASIDVQVEGAISLSGTFAANGTWGRKP